MKLSRTLQASALALAIAATVPSLPVTAQTAPAGSSAAAQDSAWTTEQLLTSSVHDAWVLSGKDESKFFDMVKVMIELSEQKRGIDLPDSVETGTRLGNNIKRLAKADTDQLLYAVVDRAVMEAARARPVPAGTRSKTATPAQ